jgi:excisionase family DNA binding protein
MENQNVDRLRTEARNGYGLLDVRAVAAQIGCSTRTVYRLADTGRMPPPVRVGRLVRWSTESIDSWIANGCPRPQPKRMRAGRARR